MPFAALLPCGLAGKESACNAGDLGSIPGLGRSPGGGNGSPLQCSGLENPMDCRVHGVAQGRTRLRGFHSLPFAAARFALAFCPGPLPREAAAALSLIPTPLRFVPEFCTCVPVFRALLFDLSWSLHKGSEGAQSDGPSLRTRPAVCCPQPGS